MIQVGSELDFTADDSVITRYLTKNRTQSLKFIYSTRTTRKPTPTSSNYDKNRDLSAYSPRDHDRCPMCDMIIRPETGHGGQVERGARLLAARDTANVRGNFTLKIIVAFVSPVFQSALTALNTMSPHTIISDYLAREACMESAEVNRWTLHQLQPNLALPI